MRAASYSPAGCTPRAGASARIAGGDGAARRARHPGSAHDRCRRTRRTSVRRGRARPRLGRQRRPGRGWAGPGRRGGRARPCRSWLLSPVRHEPQAEGNEAALVETGGKFDRRGHAAPFGGCCRGRSAASARSLDSRCASTAPRNVTVCAWSVPSDITIGGGVPEVSWASLTRGGTLRLVDAPCRRRTASLAAIVGWTRVRWCDGSRAVGWWRAAGGGGSGVRAGGPARSGWCGWGMVQAPRRASVGESRAARAAGYRPAAAPMASAAARPPASASGGTTVLQPRVLA
jgi:hypothetical protein